METLGPEAIRVDLADQKKIVVPSLSGLWGGRSAQPTAGAKLQQGCDHRRSLNIHSYHSMEPNVSPTQALVFSSQVIRAPEFCSSRRART